MHKKIAIIFRWTIWLTLGLLVIAWLALWFIKLNETVIADGLVEPIDKIELRSRVKDAILLELSAQENDSVKRGQIIARLSDQGKTKELVEETAIKLTAAAANLERSTALLEKGFISEKEAEDIRTQYLVLKTQNEIARAQLDDLTIQAPQEGRIVNLPKKEGEHVTLGDLIALIASSEEVRLRLWIEGDEVGKVFLGQKVEVLWMGSFYRDLLVGQAHLVKIYPYALERQGRFYFEALADIDEHRVPLPLGIKLRARIVGERKKLLTLLLNSR